MATQDKLHVSNGLLPRVQHIGGRTCFFVCVGCNSMMYVSLYDVTVIIINIRTNMSHENID